MYLLFDIGGTKMRLATSKDGRQLAKTLIVSTPKKFSEGIKLFTNTSLRLTEGKKIKAIAGGIAGVFDQERAKLVASPNLADWVKKPLKKQLETKLKAPVFLENDAALAGLGEAIAGAGKGKKIVAYLTISTGIGGAKIVNGEIDKKAIGFEPGHQIVNASAKFADLEAQISGGALAKRCKKHPAKISDKKI